MGALGGGGNGIAVLCSANRTQDPTCGVFIFKCNNTEIIFVFKHKAKELG